MAGDWLGEVPKGLRTDLGGALLISTNCDPHKGGTLGQSSGLILDVELGASDVQSLDNAFSG